MDKRALKILLNTFWSPLGWRSDATRVLSPEDFTYAKAKSMMFDPVTLDHAQVQNKIFQSIKKLNRRTVADAFLASLSTRRLDWRSVLGSYSVFQRFSPHAPTGDERRCHECNFYLNHCVHDLNIINFERFKWGGVRHDQLIYAAMDLDWFQAHTQPMPTDEDVQIFRDVISAISNTPLKIGSSALHSHFAKALKSNKAERDVIVAILGFCGILANPDHPDFTDYFIPADKRALPDRHFVDMPYPACWWKSEFGINQSRLREYFGHVL